MRLKKTIKTVDDYISGFPADMQKRLLSVRQTIIENAPEATESIAYGMPAYKMNNKPLVYFGAFDKHIGFYATPTGHEQFKIKLSEYKQGKGSVQFPLDKPLPVNLIADIVKFRVEENIKR